MIVRLGESQSYTAESGTYSGILIDVVMIGANVNVALAASDFKPQYVTVKATKYEKGVVTVYNDNLLVLGNYNSYYRGRHEFINGLDKKLPAAGVAPVKIRSVFLDFKQPIHVDRGEKLMVEITVASEGTFTAAVNPAISFLDYVLQTTIGYDYGTPQTIAKVIQQNSNSESVQLGDNVLRAQVMNLDQTDYQNEVISTLTLSSDKLSYTKTFNQMLAQRNLAWPGAPHYNFGSALPATGVRGTDFLPQTFNIYDGIGKGHDLDNTRIDLSMNSALVNASQNYVVYTIYHPTAEKVHKASAKAQKHQEKNIRKKLKTAPVA